MWRLDGECFEDGDSFDPLYFVRSRPVEDEEAELLEAICHAATPGPWVTDEASDGGGALVATLPDGRHVVSLRPAEACLADARSANAQLICESPCLVLRLLHDRQQWKRKESGLLEKIQALEEQIERQSEAADEAEWIEEDEAPLYPR